MCSFLIIVIYHCIKTLISFWRKQELNLRPFVQQLTTLLIELTETQKKLMLVIDPI